MPRRRALAARAAAACRPGSISTPSRCRAANARWVEMPSRRAISDAEIGSARYIAATCASETAGPAGGRVPRQTRGGEPLGHRLRVHPVPGGQLAPGEPLLLAEPPELGGRRRRFAHPARAAGTEPATTRSDRDVVLQQPRPHQMRRRVQPLRDRGDRQTVLHVQLPQPVGGGPLHRGQRPPGPVLQRPGRRRQPGLGEPPPHGATADPQPLRDRGCRQITAEFGQFLRGWRSELTPESAGTGRADLDPRLQQPPPHRRRPDPVPSLQIGGRPLLDHIQPAQRRRSRAIPAGQRHGVSGGHRASLNTAERLSTDIWPPATG